MTLTEFLAWVYNDVLYYAPSWWVIGYVTIRTAVRIAQAKMHDL